MKETSRCWGCDVYGPKLVRTHIATYKKRFSFVSYFKFLMSNQ